MRRGKKRISSQDLRYLAAFAAVATLVSSGVAYGILNPPPTEQFFAMWILGSGGLAEQYYPRDDPNLVMGEQLNWTLGVYNHMGSLQYVVIRAKLLNSTLAAPDELAGTPSPVPPIMEFSRVMVDNETWSVPFPWRISSISQRGEALLITELSVGKAVLKGELAAAVSGINYRFIFELWFYDQTVDDFAFAWKTKDIPHAVWTQIWFNVTSPALA